MMRRWPRFDEISAEAAPNIKVVIYRRKDIGVGACMSVYRGAREVLRFDLFCPAHWHRGSERDAPRHFYPRKLSFERYVALAIRDATRKIPALHAVRPWMTEQLLLRR